MIKHEEDTSLNKFISDTGFCSRREADKLISGGRVTVNGILPKLGNRVTINDEILVDGKPLRTNQKPVYLAFNKPAGVTCTTDLKDPSNIIEFLRYPGRIFPIGRLDKESEGLIFLTNDGNIVNKILRAGNNHQKEYLVTVNKLITEGFIKKMGNGVNILGTTTQKCFVKQEAPYLFRIILTQGLNRQIRRMCAAFRYKVTKLFRNRIMNISIGELETGKWRYLSGAEILVINNLVASSVKTEEASKNISN